VARPEPFADVVEEYRAACAAFTGVVEGSEGRWDAPSPCPGWRAHDVVEHVIGFHDVLVLRPLGAKASRPRSGEAARWERTAMAVFSVLDGAPPDGRVSGPAPADGTAAATVDLARLLPALAIELLVHTWDLGRATGVPFALDPARCAAAVGRVRAHADAYAAAESFAPPAPSPDGAGAGDVLVALLGRDPGWQPPPE
jgi:uncharacterized protein (TIGR03086 family)